MPSASVGSRLYRGCCSCSNQRLPAVESTASVVMSLRAFSVEAVRMRILHVLDHSLPVQSGYAFRSQAILHEQRARGWETLHVTGPKHSKTASGIEVADSLQFARVPPSGGALAA